MGEHICAKLQTGRRSCALGGKIQVGRAMERAKQEALLFEKRSKNFAHNNTSHMIVSAPI
jgi:hypothetical protein